MKRIELILQTLRALPAGQSLTASQLGERLGFSRANVSGDLNRLCEEGLTVKSGRKPVGYLAVRSRTKLGLREDSLDDFIGNFPSLVQCGELAKAAVLYPPHGINMLLIGETGVGKSTFASRIHRFALSQERMVAGTVLVTFNCADYANNPQLLTGLLFGAVKGAYTGADHDKPGLIERADGGMLFLDEVHRLPPEGQEMLFTYIDRGVFRRLGETAGERKARVLLICATTEDPQSALLRTFVRRIPMVIRIPSLFELSLDERATLINGFFTEEARRLDAKIQVSVNSIRALLGYACPGNIGQLRSDIQLLCAMAYSRFVSHEKDFIGIDSFSLPHHIRNGFFSEHNRREIWNRVPGLGLGYIVFTREGPDVPDRESSSAPSDIYQMIEQQTRDMRRVGLKEEEIRVGLNTVVERYYKNLTESAADLVNFKEIERLVGPEIIATVDRMLCLAPERFTERSSEQFSERFSSIPGVNIRWALAIHLYKAIGRMRRHQEIVNPRLEEIKTQYPRQFEAALSCLNIIRQDFGIAFPEDEAGFIAFFLDPQLLRTEKAPLVRIVVVAHGNGTASGMAQAANELTGTEIAVGFDMPLQENPGTTYQAIRKYCAALSDVREVFLLVDMGSLVDFAPNLSRDLGIRTDCCVLASTLHVLEASRKALLGYPLRRVAEDVRNIAGLALGEGQPARQTSGSALYLLTVCSTGEGNATMLKKLLEEKLDLKDGLCEIIALQITDPKTFSAETDRIARKGRIIAVAGPFDTGLPVLHLSVQDVFDDQHGNGSAMEKIQEIINLESLFQHITPAITPMLDSFDVPDAPGGERITQDIRRLIERLGNLLQMEVDEKMTVGIFCHIAFMLNRLKKGQLTAPFPGKEGFLEKYPGVIDHASRECRNLGIDYGVVIPQDEICYIAAFFTRENIM
ncbi:MAG: sigma 54-interacting transcriptional regulator [Spirochaetaceae bacterium]|jgi:transcriptional regulator with AAA-type ATPase domain/transcriptional regulatory protein LevR|nr:sigma 54-interacting transcriptional regulator [Spirochaetaceae bacterium]